MQRPTHKRLLTGIFLLLAITSPHLRASETPGFTDTNKSFTIGFQTGYFRRDFESLTTSANRYWLDAAYGVGRRLDIFARVGLSRLVVEPPTPLSDTFRDQHRVTLGGGLTFRLWPSPRHRLSFFIQGEIFTFKGSPSTRNEVRLDDSKITERTRLEYDWWEGNLNIFASKSIESLNLLAGLNINVIRRFETRIEEVLFNGAVVSESRESGEYQSGLQPRAMFGAAVQLPARLKIRLMLSGRSRSDLTLVVGLSQSGSP